MKGSKREVKILIALLVVLAGYAFFTFALKPLMQDVGDLQVNVANEAATVQQTYEDTWSYEDNVAEIRRKSLKIVDIANHYYTTEEQEEFLDQVDRWLQESGLTYTEVKADAAILVSGDGNGATAGFGDDTSEDKVPVLRSPITILAKGNYSNVMNLLNSLMRSNKKTIAYEMSIDVAQASLAARSADPEVTVSISQYFLNLKAADMTYTGSAEDLYQIPDRPDSFTIPRDLGEYGRPFSVDQMPAILEAFMSRFT